MQCASLGNGRALNLQYQLKQQEVVMKTLITFFLAAVSFSQCLIASEGAIEIVGRAESEAPPEFTTIQVSVTSICYDQSRGAKDANAILSNDIIKILQKFVKKEKDKVTAKGGQNVRQTEYTTSPDGTTRVLCDKKWRATNSISLQTADLADIPEIQDQVLAAIDKMEGINPNKVAQSYAELMQPNFFLYPETVSRLQKEVQKKAWDDAKEQLQVFKDKCTFKNAMLKSIGQPGFSRYPVAENLPHVKSAYTPIIPDTIHIKAVWQFVWSFEQSTNCRL